LPAIPTNEILSRGIDVAFVALHGRYGEDGCVQGLLEILGIPYTGSDVLSSALAMDKVRSKEIVSFHGILTPKWMVVAERRWKEERDAVLRAVSGEFGYPCVAKVPEEGSSFGMGIPTTPGELIEVMDRSIGERGHMMIEEYVEGTEITCSVLGGMLGERPTALPLTEIIPKTSKYFDFEAKYTPGASEEITPARLDEQLTKEAREIGARVHEALGCGSMSRTDMIVRGRDIYYLETNTIPGMTETSLYPQAARAAGMSFSELLDKQIELALAYHKRRG
jgi:D-alanine-D-alanine ligase